MILFYLLLPAHLNDELSFLLSFEFYKSALISIFIDDCNKCVESIFFKKFLKLDFCLLICTLILKIPDIEFMLILRFRFFRFVILIVFLFLIRLSRFLRLFRCLSIIFLFLFILFISSKIWNRFFLIELLNSCFKSSYRFFSLLNVLLLNFLILDFFLGLLSLNRGNLFNFIWGLS